MALTGVLVVGGASAAAPDSSLTLNGTTQYVRVGQADANPDKLNAATFTLEAWFNRSGNGATTTTGTGGVTAAPLIAKGRGEAENSNVDMNYFLGIDANGRLVADYEEGAGQTSPGLNHPITGTATITNGVWHHTAATFDGTSWRLYLDGRLDATLTVGANRAPRSDSIQDTAIGSALTSTGAAAGFFQGSVDEVRVWNTARTWEQIRDAKDDEVTSAAALVGRWGLDEGSGTTAADSTANPLSGTLVNAPTWLLGQYGFPQDATPPAAPAGVSAVAANASISLAWTTNADTDLAGYNVYRGTSPGVSTTGAPLNGDTLLQTPSYTDATAANGTTYYYAVTAVDTANNKASTEVSATPSATLTALRFDGTNDYVTFGPAAALASPTFTLETWFMRTGAGVGQSTGAGGLASALPLVSKGRNESEASNVDMNYFLGIDTATNRLAVDFEEGANGTTPGLNHPLIGTTAIANGVWHHAAATYDGTTWRLYLDGQPDGSLLVGQPARGDSIQHAALGTAMNSTGVAGGFFQGVLDEARIWGVARTQAEIGGTIGQELTSGSGLLGRWGLNEGAGTTAGDSVGGTNGTLTNGPAWVVGYPLAPPPAGPHALQFDGTNDHVTFGQATTKLGVSQFTLEAWFRRTGAGVGTNTGSGGIPNAIPLITKGRAEAEASNVDMNYFLGIDASTGVLVGDFEDTATGGNHPVSGVTAIAAGAAWHHAAATYDGTTWRVYLDGKLETRLSVGSFTPRSDSIQHAALGTAMNSTGVAAGFFQGVLDEVRVWGSARSGAQIRSAKDSEISGPQSGLRARWSLDEGGGTSVGDTSGNDVTGTAVGGGAWVPPYDFPQDSTAPAAPTGLNATPGDGEAALSWSPNGEPDLAGYNLFRGTSSPVSTSGTPLNGDDLIRAANYQDDGVTNGTTYYYALVAVDASNNASGPSGEANTTPFPAGSKGLQFDGSTQHVTFGAAPGLASPTFTLETWFMRTGPGVGQQTGSLGLASAVPLITKGRNEVDQGDNRDMNYFLGLDTATNRLAVDFEEGSAGSSPSLNHPLIGATAVTSNVWHHVAATYDGARWKLYLDGRLDASLLVGEPARGDSIQHAALGTAMTSTGVAGGFFQGLLDEARVWNRARTGAEIRAGKNSEAPASATGLRGHWHLDEASGTLAADSSGNANNGTAVGGPLHVSAYGFPQDAIAPAAVQGLGASAGDGSVTLSWTAGSEADLAGYNVYRSTSSPVDTGGSPLNGADLLSSPSFTDSGLTNGLTYHYAVVAVDTADNAAAPEETSAVPTASDPVFVGAGDIADCARTQDAATADLVAGIPGTVWTAGDNVYQNGTATEFANCYDPTWGAVKARTRPTVGNHDYGNGSNNGEGYFDYFNGVGSSSGPAGDRDKGYYSYDIGDHWHVVSLNSECEIDAACTMAAQEQWLRGDLAASSARNVVGIFHRPRWTSGATRPGDTRQQVLWQALYDYGAEVVLVGHDHHYERFGPQDGSGQADANFGVREFVVGTGGAAFTGLGTTAANSQVRNSGTNGVLKLTLHESSYDWQFVPVAGQTFTDSGTAAVHGPPPDTAAPAVTIVSAVPSSLGPSDASTEVTWRASEDGSYSVRVGGADCTAGVVVASGAYGTSPARVVTTVDADDLAEGPNAIRVCVSDAASNTGSAATTVSKNSVAAAHALGFDGVNDYVTFGQATGSLGGSQFTLETWFRRAGAGVGTSTGSGGIAAAVPLIAKGRAQQDGSNLDMNYLLGIDASSGVLVADFEDAATGGNHPVAGTTTIPADNAWHHAAVSYDGTSWRLYLDGRMDAKLNVGATPRSDSIQHAALGSALDSTGSAAGFFNGALDEVRIWGVARTGAEIRASRDSELTGSPTGLRGRWALNEGLGSSAGDSSGNGVVGTLVNGPTWPAGYGFPADTTAPAAPTGLSAAAGDGQASVTWNSSPAPDVAGYNLYRSTSSPVSTAGTPINGGDLIGATSYTDSGLSNGTTYHYVVVAVDGANNASGASGEASASPVQGDPVFVGAGDIAGADWNGDEATAQLLDQIPGAVFTLGDSVYQNGTAAEFAAYYEPTWGRHRSRTRPTPGNHDYNTPNATGYYDYFNGSGNFTGPAGDRDKGYYSYDLEGNGVRWHVVVLNSECEASTGLWLPGGCAAGSPQEQWLRTDLENALTNNIIALWHKPRYSSTTLQPHMQALWQALYDYGVDLTLGGHWHNYERLAPMDASGVADPAHGVRQFVVGTGGAGFAGFNSIWPASEVRNSSTNGVIKLTLHASSYDWQFVPVAGQTFTDSGTAAVHGPPPDTAAPAVTVVSAVPSSLGPSDASTDVTWHASENGSYSVRVGGADCTGGVVVATGAYSTSPADVVTTVDADDLADGQNTIRVCVTDAATNTGSAATTVSKNSVPPAHALSFDGVNDYVTFGQATTSLGASQFTLETWFRRAGAGVGTSTGSGGIAAAVPLIAKGRAQQDASNLDMNYILGIDASSGVLVADFEDAATGGNHPVAGTTTIPADNTWHHAAVSYDGTNWRLYLDGRMDAKLNVGATPRSDSIQHAALGSALDSTGSAAGFFNGTLDGVRIWGVARTGAQIRANRDSELSGSPTGLRGRWALNEGLGTSAGDSSGNGVAGTLVNGPTWVAGYGFPPDTTAPAAPTGLGVAAGDGQVSLTWNANAEPDVAGYNLYRSTSSPVSTAGAPINGADLVGGTSYSDTGLSNGTTYHYVVVAVDGADNRSDASGEASGAPVQGDPVFVGAGDIADCARTQDSATGDLVAGIPGTVWTAGDNVYQNGTAAEFANCYDPTWGAVKARTRPTIGNHDYGNGSNSGEGYFDYFNGAGNPTGPAGDRDKGYYSYDIGDHWHVVSLNSECEIDAACAVAAQEQWLRGDLAANSARNVVGIFHRPRWSSGATRPGDTRQQGLWQTLYEYGAEVVLVGHDHHYERFAPQDGSGQADSNFGVREFVVGTGGAAFTGLGTTAANSQVRNSGTYGVLKLTLHESSYDWQFVPISGQTFTDSGTSQVHAAPNVRPVVDSVTINETAPRTNDTLTATVTSHDPNGDSVTYAYQWRRNGVDIAGATGPTLALSTFGDKGDQISLRVTASDAGGAGAPLTSSAVTVQNTPPTATVSLSSHTPTTNQVVTATATRADADADTVLLTYVWRVNGAVRKTTSASSSLTDTFDLSQADNGDGGDTVTVEVTPNDGTADGPAAVDMAVVDSAPAPPTGLTATLSTTAVTLDWNNNSEPDLAGYNVYRAGSLAGPYTKLNGALLTGSVYVDAGAPVQATSYYRVTAVDTGSAESTPAATSVQRGIAFRASSSAQTSGASLALARPNGVVAGDVLVAVVDVRGAPSITAPAGWSLVRVDTNGTALRQAVYLRVAQGSEPTSYAWGFASKQTAAGAVLAYAGVSTSGPLDASSGRTNASSTSITANALTTSVPDTVVIGLFGTATNGSISPPAATTEQVEIAVGGKLKAAAEGADALKAGTGSTGTVVATSTAAAVNIGQLVALRPVGAVPPQDTEPPTPPSSLAATAVSSSQIDLTWTAATDNVGVDHYEVTRGTNVVDTTTLTHFSDIGLSPSTPYTYTIKAVDAAGNFSAASDPASATTPPTGPAGITLRAAATAAARSAASLSIGKPAGTQSGDVLLASLDVRATPAISPPVGWTLVRRDEAAGTLTKATYWHLVGSSEPASFAWTFSAAQPASGVILAYSGADSANPVGPASGAVVSSETSVTTPSVDVAAAGSVLVSFVGFATNTSISPPAGMTERSELIAGAGQARVTGESSDVTRAAGASGPRTATAAKAAAGAGQLVVVRPAP